MKELLYYIYIYLMVLRQTKCKQRPPPHVELDGTSFLKPAVAVRVTADPVEQNEQNLPLWSGSSHRTAVDRQWRNGAAS